MRNCDRCGFPRTSYRICSTCTDRMQSQLAEKDKRIAELDDVGRRLDRAYVKKCKEVEEWDARIDAAVEQLSMNSCTGQSDDWPDCIKALKILKPTTGEDGGNDEHRLL